MGDYTGRNQKRSILLNLQAAQKVDALKEFSKLTILVSDRKRSARDRVLPSIFSHREKTEGNEMINLLDESPRLKGFSNLILPLLEFSSSRPDVWKQPTTAGFLLDTSLDLEDEGSTTSKNQNKLIKQYVGLILESSVREKIRQKHELIERQKKKKLQPIKRFNLSVEGRRT